MWMLLLQGSDIDINSLFFDRSMFLAWAKKRSHSDINSLFFDRFTFLAWAKKRSHSDIN